MAETQTSTKFNAVSDSDLTVVLTLLKNLLQSQYQKSEMKTGSTTERKVLSDNNLTDELLTKLQNAGTSSFDGNYESLTGKPTIPSSVSQLTNDSGFVTTTEVNQKLTDLIETALEELNALKEMINVK